MKNIMVRGLIVAAVLLQAGSALSLAEVQLGESRAAQIAKDARIPGKGVPGKCLTYANVLHERLQAAGIPSQVIVFGYMTAGLDAGTSIGSWSGGRGAHAVVSYKDAGRTYVMDNQSWKPRSVEEGAPVQMAQRFSGLNCNVKTARVLRGASSNVPPLDPNRKIRLLAD